uniref:Uncharacterized protein n=1 Tax=Romanomermis culicivorax TaxID=13658 RepID=A0A915KCK8_ROMCU
MLRDVPKFPSSEIMPFLKKKIQGQKSNPQSVPPFNASPYYYSSYPNNNNNNSRTTQLNSVYRNNKVYNDDLTAKKISTISVDWCEAEEVAEDVRQYIKGKFSGKRENNSFESDRVSQLPPFPYYDHSPPAPIFPNGGSSTSNSATAAARLAVPSTNGQAPIAVVPLPLSNGRPSPSSNGGGAERQSNRNYYVERQMRQSSTSNGFQTPTNFERDV